MSIHYNIFLIFLVLANSNCNKAGASAIASANYNYYVDSQMGDDSNNGSHDRPFRSLDKVNSLRLHAGDSLLFKRGSSFDGYLKIRYSGTAEKPIVVTSYGSQQLSLPKFTNSSFTGDNFGNCIRLQGSHIEVDGLFFYNTLSLPDDFPSKSFLTVWQIGAVYIDTNATRCTIRNVEIEDCVVGIKSYGKEIVIQNNYIHDCNRVLANWGWGPIGIWLGADYQEVSNNRIFNYRTEDSRISWGSGIGGGADGGAIEIDDARRNKTHISIHHNFTRDCQGFMEVTQHDVTSNPVYEGFRIHHNISDDYQQFIALWDGSKCKIENNTIVRRKVNVNDWGVFNITEQNSKNLIRNNIIVVEKNIPIFNVGLRMTRHPENMISNNLYFAASGSLVMGYEGPGINPVYGDPAFKNYSDPVTAEDYNLTPASAAIDKGINTGYLVDFENTTVPNGSAADIGAFEYVK